MLELDEVGSALLDSLMGIGCIGGEMFDNLFVDYFWGLRKYLILKISRS